MGSVLRLISTVSVFLLKELEGPLVLSGKKLEEVLATSVNELVEFLVISGISADFFWKELFCLKSES